MLIPFIFVCTFIYGAAKAVPISFALSFAVTILAFTIALVFLSGANERELRMIKNRIKEYRAKYDMKQKDLAKLVGVRRETIGNLEKGKYNPSLVLAWKIAKVFNVSIEEVFIVEE